MCTFVDAVFISAYAEFFWIFLESLGVGSFYHLGFVINKLIVSSVAMTYEVERFVVGDLETLAFSVTIAFVLG